MKLFIFFAAFLIVGILSQEEDAGEIDAATIEASTTTEKENTEASTEPPITAIPLNRNVSFKIDCSGSTQCSFEFRIAEPLMRFINQTYLEDALGLLASKIQDINTDVATLSTEETSYQNFLEAQITKNIGNFTETLTLIEDKISTIDDLQNRTDTFSTIAEKYLKSAQCFQNDADTSEGCGNLASLNADSDNF